MTTYDVAVVGAGPAGATAARVAAAAGASVALLDRSEMPRYKCCGGGLVGLSTRSVPFDLTPLVRDVVTRVTFTKEGRQRYTRRAPGGLFRLVLRADLDAALADAAVAAGAEALFGAGVTRITPEADAVALTLAGGREVRARTVVGADGTGGRTGGYVGVVADQVDVGLEGEFPTSDPYWDGRVLIDWGPVPGSYGWVFPKAGQLSAGVIGPRSRGAEVRAYYEAFVARLGLGEPLTFAGHLTRVRAAGSPLRRGRVLVAGDAAGLLEPWTREGISYALRSGALAGAAAADGTEAGLAAYPAAVEAALGPEMAAGRAFLRTFERNRQVFHGFLAAVPGGWRLFSRLVAGETTLSAQYANPLVRAALRVF